MNRLLALAAFVIFALFLAIMAWEVPEPDLIVIIVLTVALAGWDLATSSNRRD